jgi:hypothetical protein
LSTGIPGASLSVLAISLLNDFSNLLQKEKKMLNNHSEKLHKDFGFTEEHIKNLERYTDACIDITIKQIDALIFKGELFRGDLEKVFSRFELYCLCCPRGLREDYKHPDIYWELDIWYKFSATEEDTKDRFNFRDFDSLDVFLRKIGDKEGFIELDCGVILFPSAIAKMVFGVTQQKHKCKNEPYFFVQVVEKDKGEWNSSIDKFPHRI